LKTALITGIDGQDGAYLTRLLISKGYRVFGVGRSLDPSTHWRLEQLGVDPRHVTRIQIDLLNQESWLAALEISQATEVYHLAALSSVRESWIRREETMLYNTMAPIQLFEAALRCNPSIKIYQASSSEMFGEQSSELLSEDSPCRPKNPYGLAKLLAHHAAINYRKAYSLRVSCGIMFNHESPLRTDSFVFKKIIQGACLIHRGKLRQLDLGNLESQRDWGFAGDYVQAMWSMLQQPHTEDFVIATGRSRSIRDLCAAAFSLFSLDYQEFVRENPAFLRPADPEICRGDSGKARNVFGWVPTTSFEDLISMMADHELKKLTELS
jgi:GDPmannose 4,6-dehydratase